MVKNEIIWLIEERTFAELVNLNAYFATVHYTREGIDYEVIVTTDDIEFITREDDDDEN